MTSDHRVAGSSPAGCKTSLIKDLKAVWHFKNKHLKNAVIRLLSGYPVLLASLAVHVRTNPRNLLASEYGLSLESRETMKLTKRAPTLAKYAGLVGLRPEKFLNPFLEDFLQQFGGWE
jgi:hypothetical protein